MRWIVVVAALGLRAIVVLARFEPPPTYDYRWGVVKRLETFGGVHYLRMVASNETFDIVYTGELTDRICVGQDAFAEGFTDGSNGFITTSLTIGACFKGNECRPYACYPDDKRPPECRTLSARSSS